MAIKETPISINVYYKHLKDVYTKKEKELRVKYDNLRLECEDLHKKINQSIELYKEKYNINLLKFKEFDCNKYIDGSFFRAASYLIKQQDVQIIQETVDLYTLAVRQKEFYDISKEYDVARIILTLTPFQHRDILRKFYEEVHKQMIINGCGYAFEGSLGWICINRCKLEKSAPKIDYKATKEKKKQILDSGGRLYNKEEAEWCKQNNIKYDGVDGRVFRTNEYCYEIPLIGCRLENGRSYKLEITDYRHAKCRGKTNEQLIEECDNDIYKICKLPVDLKTKLNLSVKADNMLYLNFIRNENQKPLAAAKTYSKD